MQEPNDPSPAALLTPAEEAGLRLRVRGQRLQARGPAAALAQYLPLLKAQEGAVRRLLRSEPPGAISRTPERPWRCHRCWRYFAEAELNVVAETIGRGFRCAACLRRERRV